MTENKPPSLIKNALSNWLALAVNIITGFLLTPFIIGHLGKAGYGIWTLIGSFVGYYGLLNLGVGSAVSRYIAYYRGSGETDQEGTYASTALSMFYCTGIIVGVVSFFIAKPLAVFFEVKPEDLSSFVSTLRLLGLSTAITFPTSVLTAIIMAYEYYVPANMVQIFMLLLRAGMTVLLLNLGLGLYGVSFAVLVTSIFSFVLYMILLKKYCKKVRLYPALMSLPVLKTMLFFGGPTFIISVADIIRINMDSLVIAKWVNLEKVGVYGIAAMLISHMGSLVLKAVNVFAPRFAWLAGASDSDGLKSLFAKAIAISAMLSFGATLIAMVCGKSFIMLWVGAEYEEAAFALWILSLAFCIAVSQNPSISLLYALNKHRYYALVTVIEAAINFSVSIILAMKWGMLGVAAGTLFAGLIIKIFVLPFFVAKIAAIRVYAYLMYFFPYVAAFSLNIGAAVVYFNYFTLPSTYTGIFLLGVIFGTSYLTLCLLLMERDTRGFLLSRLFPANLIYKMILIRRKLFQSIFGTIFSIRPKNFGRRKVLLVCNDALMAEYLKDVYEILKDDKRIKMFLAAWSKKTDRENAGEYVRALLPLKEISVRWANVINYDLVVTADHIKDKITDSAKSPSIMIQHGISCGKIVDSHDYVWGGHNTLIGGRPRYTFIFESSEVNVKKALTVTPELDGHIIAVGDIKCDKMLKQSKQREEFRRKLGLSNNDEAVFILSSWGPNCLWRTMGETLLERFDELSSKFKFIVNIHPHEFREREDGGRVWGNFLRDYCYGKYIFREPDEDWINYLISADVILTDFTSLAIQAAILGKPMVYIDFNEKIMDPNGLSIRLKQISPVVSGEARNLGSMLNFALKYYPYEKLAEIVREIISYQGEAETRVKKIIYQILELDMHKL